MLKDQSLQNDLDHYNSLKPQVPLDRRSFIAAAIAAGFAVSAEPTLAQAVRTPMDGLDGGDLKIGDIPAYYAVKKGTGKRPVIMVIPEIWGLHEYQKDMCRRLARAGYFAVSSDPFYRGGDLSKVADIKEVLKGANALSDQLAFEDLDKVLAWAEKHPRANTQKLAVTGHCRGGRMVWMYTAHQKKVDAAVAWYGPTFAEPTSLKPQNPVDVTDKIDRPVLGLYAGADTGIPQTHVDRMRAGLHAFGHDKKSQIHVYPEMPHGFHADYRPTYRKQQAEDGWKRMLAWFRKHGVA